MGHKSLKTLFVCLFFFLIFFVVVVELQRVMLHKLEVSVSLL